MILDDVLFEDIWESITCDYFCIGYVGIYCCFGITFCWDGLNGGGGGKIGWLLDDDCCVGIFNGVGGNIGLLVGINDGGGGRLGKVGGGGKLGITGGGGRFFGNGGGGGRFGMFNGGGKFGRPGGGGKLGKPGGGGNVLLLDFSLPTPPWLPKLSFAYNNALAFLIAYEFPFICYFGFYWIFSSWGKFCLNKFAYKNFFFSKNYWLTGFSIFIYFFCCYFDVYSYS